ncbi:MAG: Sec-independent protein translocase subunit TatA/TatB [Flavobacteriales bacterium]
MGATEIIFIFAVYLLLFGSKGIPSLAKTMGQAVRTFRNATEDIQREILSDAPKRTTDFSNVRDVSASAKSEENVPQNMGDGPVNPEGKP